MKSNVQRHSKPTSARHLDIYRVALRLIACCRPLLAPIRRHNRRTGDQLIESLSSILQNICEGMRRVGKDRAHLLTIALGSCEEVRGILDGAEAFGVITAAEHEAAEELADRVCAMGYRLREKVL